MVKRGRRQEAGGRRQANITLILNTNITLAYNKFLAYEAKQGRTTKDLYLSVYLERRFVVTHDVARRGREDGSEAGEAGTGAGAPCQALRISSTGGWVGWRT